MPLIHLDDVPAQEQRSPSGRFHSFKHDISVALGAKYGVGTWGGGHPFDVQQRRIPPGAAVCPYHTHFGQWEFFVVETGEATVRVNDERHVLRGGEACMHPPGECHQITNTGASDLLVWIIADNPPLDVCHYPDSGKWAMRPPMSVFLAQSANYFEGEDAPFSETPGKPLLFDGSPLPLAGGARFAKCRIDDLPWEEWTSPGGKYGGRSQQVSIALGDKKGRVPPGLGGHPFDLEREIIAPGKFGSVLHSHAAQWEMYVIRSGRARMRTLDATYDLRPGHVILHPPGEAHEIMNPGDEPLDIWIIADTPPLDVFHYPESNKWGSSLPGPDKFHRRVVADYWDGEE